MLTCPWCATSDTRSVLLGHVLEAHPDRVETEMWLNRMSYGVTCPQCGESYHRQMRKAARNPEFVNEFDREIRLVALDMLLTHIQAEHQPSGG